MSFEEIVADAFEIDPADVRDDMTPESVELWDSLSHLTLIGSLEKQLSVKLSMEEIQAIDSVGKLREIIASHASA